MIIGLCGNSGSGKSTLAKTLINLNQNTIHLDIDKIGHKSLMMEDVKKELIKKYGESIQQGENISRKRLGEIVFASRIEMENLTELTWKYMQIEIDKFIEENKDKIIILDWILLPESKYFDMCDIKVLLDIPYEVRKQRAIKRDNITEEAFDLREKASINYDRTKFDLIIEDNEKIDYKRLVK